jgi:hypothetical protein
MYVELDKMLYNPSMQIICNEQDAIHFMHASEEYALLPYDSIGDRSR